MLEGIREGFFDYYKKLNRRKCLFKIERVFLLQRILFLLLLVILMSYKLEVITSIIVGIGQICMFKYFHKELYDISTNKLNGDILENESEFNIFKIMNKYKKTLLIFGISVQIFTYFII
jgi:hypothetical protein